jgi:hypothetical protein
MPNLQNQECKMTSISLASLPNNLLKQVNFKDIDSLSIATLSSSQVAVLSTKQISDITTSAI